MLRRKSVILALAVLPVAAAFAATLGGPLPGPFPLFPSDNWWNLDVSSAPLDSGSASFINFIGPTRGLHPDFGGEESTGSVAIYGFPYLVVKGTQPKKTVQFYYWKESDGVNNQTGVSFPFYPIPDEAISQNHWVEGGQPGNQDLRDSADRHMLIVDEDNKHLYELYNVYFDGTTWQAGSGAFFDMNTNNRRPDTWTSADAAGLAILPGLVRYDEAFGTAEIGHAFRVTVRSSNGYRYPASHEAGSTLGALPMGARLRLKAGKDISGFSPECQRIFRAMKKYGLVVADNGSDMYVSGTFDTRWDNDVLNPAFGALKASDFEVIQLGWNPTPGQPSLSINNMSVTEGNSGTVNATFTVTLSAASTQTVTVNWTSANGTATAGSDYLAGSGTLSFAPGVTTRSITVVVNGDTAVEPNETFLVNLSSPSGATLGDGQGQGTITNDDSQATSKAVMQTPAPGSTLSGSTATFTWNTGTGVTSYWLEVGTTAGGKQIYPGASTTALSATVGGLPTNGSTVYVRLWSQIAGSWVFNDYTYKASGSGGGSAKAVMQTPAPGSTLSGSTATFTWNAGTGVAAYWLEVGTTAGGKQIYPGASTTALSATVGGLPTNGSTVYVRLWSLISGAWQYNDYTYKASVGGGSAKAVMQTPAPGSTLAGSAVTFTWNAGTGVTSYWLEVGTTAGGNQLYPGASTTALSATVGGLPTGGSTVYVRLWSRINGTWVFNDYTYKASGSGGGSAKSVMQTPAPGSTLAGSTVTFTWNAGTGVTSYWLEVGTTPGGKNISAGSNTTSLSASVTGLPTNGSTVYVRLWSMIGGTWVYNDYTYIAAP